MATVAPSRTARDLPAPPATAAPGTTARGRARLDWLSHATLALFMVLALAPILLMWVTALKTQTELATNPFGLPRQWVWSNFVQTWRQGQFATYLRSSVVVVIPVVAGATALSVLAGYAFGAFRFRGRTLLFGLFLLGVMVPTEGLVIPLYYFLDAFGLRNTYWALILPQVALSTSFGTFWMRAFFTNLPADLSDAAAVDGAGPLRTLWSVLLPLARPALGTLGVLVFMWTWNEFLLALVLVSDGDHRTVPVALSLFQGRYSAQVPLLAAAATIVSGPVLVLYALLHRKFIEGMVAGSVKG
jgi:raffinose/stachyose/melibiose transport system permease protein